MARELAKVVRRILSLREMPGTYGGNRHFWREAIVQGRLPFIRTGSKYFIRTTAAESFLEEHRQKATG